MGIDVIRKNVKFGLTAAYAYDFGIPNGASSSIPLT